MTNEDIEKLDAFMCEIIESEKPDFTYNIEAEHYKSGQINAAQRIMKYCMSLNNDEEMI